MQWQTTSKYILLTVVNKCNCIMKCFSEMLANSNAENPIDTHTHRHLPHWLLYTLRNLRNTKTNKLNDWKYDDSIIFFFNLVCIFSKFKFKLHTIIKICNMYFIFYKYVIIYKFIVVSINIYDNNFNFIIILAVPKFTTHYL